MGETALDVNIGKYWSQFMDGAEVNGMLQEVFVESRLLLAGVLLCKGEIATKARTLFEIKDCQSTGRLSRADITALWREAGDIVAKDTAKLAQGDKEFGFLSEGELNQYLTPIGLNTFTGSEKITSQIFEAVSSSSTEITKEQWI
jgi:hypothetical protein